MNFIRQLSITAVSYANELWFILAVGFLLSGLLHVFIPSNLVERYLGKKGYKPILFSSVVGVLLPVCCLGSLPIAITLRKKGASLGSVLAFLVATPATSVSALFVCWKLLGMTFTVFIFFATIIMALIMGIVSNGIHVAEKALTDQEHDNHDHCCRIDTSQEQIHKIGHLIRLRGALRYAFITLPKEIGLEILLGILVASFITVFEPLQHFIQSYLTGLAGYFFILVMGLLTYVCSTASVPLADALIQSGMSQGQALCYLIVGPITSYGTMLVIKKDFGSNVLIIYLSIISISALFFGMAFDLFQYPI